MYAFDQHTYFVLFWPVLLLKICPEQIMGKNLKMCDVDVHHGIVYNNKNVGNSLNTQQSGIGYTPNARR